MATVLQRTGSGAYYSKLTMSFWIKRSKLGEQGIFGRREGSATANLSTCHFSGDDSLLINFRDGGGTSKYYMITSKFFKDVGAWYHIHIMLDGDNATQGDRSKLYVNGVRETSFQLLNNPSSTGYEVNLFVGGSYNTYIGRGLKSQTDAWLTYEGCMSNFNCSTGYVYEPTVFGEVDTTTGQWKIINDPTFTPGTDGFTILKDGNTITDQSAGSNNFSLYSGTLTNTLDCPSNVFATGNPLIGRNSSGTNLVPALSNGNLTALADGSTWQVFKSTLGASSGKYYAEFKWISDSNTRYAYVGIYDEDNYANKVTGYPFMSDIANSVGYYSETGAYYTGGSPTSFGSSFNSSGDGIQGVAVDLDNSKLYFSKNGVWQGSGDPSNGTGGISITANRTYTLGLQLYAVGSIVYSANFGNGYFGTTAVTSAGTNASGIGIFEYDVPTGYTALSTKGLNL